MMIQRSGNSREACVLLSGGIDSAACIVFYLENNFSVRCLFIDYGQASAELESKSSKAIANHYNVSYARYKWSGAQRKNPGMILGRNAFLLISALMELPDYTGILAVGVHSDTPYYDCTPKFLKKMQSIFNAYTQGIIQIDSPFLKWTKCEILKFCKSRNVPLELTYSCERGFEQPCGQCLSCLDLEKFNACS